MFRIMRNKPISGTEGLLSLEKTLRERLPDTWSLAFKREVPGPRARADAVVELTGPTGERATVVVEYKSNLAARDVGAAIAQARQYGGDAVLVAAPFLGLRSREVIIDSGAGYADATGNFRLRLDKPALFIDTSGAESNPWPDHDAPLRSLKGPAAGRVVRAVCEIAPPYGIRQLAKRSGVPVSTTSRVVALLEREALLTRGPDAAVVEVDWQKTIRRWTQDYSLMKSNRTEMYVEPRRLDALLSKLAQSKWEYSVTGSLAAAARGQITAPRLAIVYVTDLSSAAERLGIGQVDAGGNVMLAEPFGRVVFDRTWTMGNVVYAGLAQVAADLITGPGRGPAEGDSLIRWMESNEQLWRA